MATNQNHKNLPFNERPPRRRAYHKHELDYRNPKNRKSNEKIYIL